MARGRKTGGRVKGTPNRVTADARAAFQAVYQKRLGDLDRWLGEAGDGFEAVKVLKDGTKVSLTVGKDPGKAADILTRMAEHFVPKLQRLEKTIADATDDELLAEVRRRREAREADGPGGS